MRFFNSTSLREMPLAGILLFPLTVAMILSAVQTASAQATVFEGARLIAGDGSAPIEDSAFVVQNGRITAVGRRGQVNAPAGTARVSLAGKTVMPAIIDTHKHLGITRDALVDQLQRFAYYGIGVATSLGQDAADVVFQVRGENISNAARYRTAGRGITTPEPGRSNAPYWITSEAEGRKAVQEQAARKVDLIKIWVDDRNGQYKPLGPEMFAAVIDEAHKSNLRVTAHIYALDDSKALLRAGIDAFAHSIRDKVVDDEFIQMIKARPNVVLVPTSWPTPSASTSEKEATFPKGRKHSLKERPNASASASPSSTPTWNNHRLALPMIGPWTSGRAFPFRVFYCLMISNVPSSCRTRSNRTVQT